MYILSQEQKAKRRRTGKADTMTDLTGKRFGKLTVLGPGERRRGRFTWRCRCDCGAVVDKRTDDLKSRRDLS